MTENRPPLDQKTLMGLFRSFNEARGNLENKIKALEAQVSKQNEVISALNTKLVDRDKQVCEKDQLIKKLQDECSQNDDQILKVLKSKEESQRRLQQVQDENSNLLERNKAIEQTFVEYENKYKSLNTIARENELKFKVEVSELREKILYQQENIKRKSLEIETIRSQPRFQSLQQPTPVLIQSQPPVAKLTGEDNLSQQKPLQILILGPPAGGKGTQSAKIVEKYGLIHLSTGDMLRNAISKGTDMGREAKLYMDARRLVPDHLVNGIVKNRLTLEDCKKKGWVLDGFPRTAKQAEFLKNEKLIPDVILQLEVPDEQVVERVVGRRRDPVTRKTYHIKFDPAPSEEINKRLTQRDDDTEENCKVRLKYYYHSVKGIVGHFEKIQKVDGNQPKEKVFEAIVKILDALLKQK